MQVNAADLIITCHWFSTSYCRSRGLLINLSARDVIQVFNRICYRNESCKLWICHLQDRYYPFVVLWLLKQGNCKQMLAVSTLPKFCQQGFVFWLLISHCAAGFDFCNSQQDYQKPVTVSIQSKRLGSNWFALVAARTLTLNDCH